MKVLLVNPACADPRIFGEDARVVPIGLYYIGAMLLENGVEAHILNLADGGQDPVRLFCDRILADRPDVIGFSVTTPSRWNALDCAKEAKKRLPQAKVVFGGPCPTFLYSHLMAVCPELDAVVLGEGEITFLELVRAWAANLMPESIAGLVLNKNGNPLKTPDRHLLENLDHLPHPSRWFTFRHLALSRGCPGNCTFCGSPKFWGSRKVRFHSAAWMADEMAALAKNGVFHFYLSDNTFSLDKPRVLEFCRCIEEKIPGITWNAISRADHVDEEVLFAMRRAGCIQISFGVESGSEKIRKTLGKPMDKKTIVRAFSLTRAFGILPRAYFIYGSPGETRDTIRESAELIQEIRPLSAIFYMLTLFPGTALYHRAEKQGRIGDGTWQNRIEDVPWFELDENLDFTAVKAFGDTLRDTFFSRVDEFATDIDLIDRKELYPFHADFLSRLGMTFSHGEYAADPRVKNQEQTARGLFERALFYAPDARAFLGLAMLAQKQRDMDRAIRILNQGLEKFPQNPNLSLCMGISLMNKNEFESALAIFRPFGQDPRFLNYIGICRQKKQGNPT